MRIIIPKREKRLAGTVVVTRFLFLPKGLPNESGELELRWLCRSSFYRKYKWVHYSTREELLYEDLKWYDGRYEDAWSLLS